MSAFDNVIGYEPIKKEMLRVCDMIRNPEIYREIGAVLPRGMLLYGDPGLGKTLMAEAFIRESGLKFFQLRKNMTSNELISEITGTFRKAADEAPCIIFIDDLDKFANEDTNHRDAEEYAAVQAGIDDVKGLDVFVIATVNEYDRLPSSLCRPGRFDIQIEFEPPCREDASQIIQFYLKGKKIDETVNLEDLSRMMDYESCAALESVMNEAAIYAAYERKNAVGMQDLVRAVLRWEYKCPESILKTSSEEIRKNALHEAGHAVVSETVIPGSVGMVSVRGTEGSHGGLTHTCVSKITPEDEILIALGGKAAVEMYYPERAAEGCGSDLEKAARAIRFRTDTEAAMGFGLFDVRASEFDDPSPIQAHKEEIAVQNELERSMSRVRGILLNNREFLERMTDELIRKETLLYSDIKRIKAMG